MAKKSLLSAPTQAAPHPKLMALVGQFLQQNGFHSAHQTYDTERSKIVEKKQRKDINAQRSITNLPSLETIFQTWLKEHSKETSSASSSDNDTSSSSSDETTDSDEIATSKDSDEDSGSSDNESSLESSSDSDSEEDASEPERTTITVVSDQKPAKSTKRKLSYSSSESSDTSDENPVSAQLPSVSRPSKKARIGSKYSTSSSDEESESSSASDTDSDSDSDSSSVSETHKIAVNTELPSSSESSSTNSSEDDESESEKSSDDDIELNTVATSVPLIDQALSDSSGTIMGDVGLVQTASNPSAAEEATEATQTGVTKRRHIGAHPTRLAQISAAADLNDYVSNTYVSYDYADKAYNDLSVTRGKGFTKEKNKKKRGSYRGGAIDISGGKAFKFDD